MWTVDPVNGVRLGAWPVLIEYLIFQFLLEVADLIPGPSS
jgi:hypothetical protein